MVAQDICSDHRPCVQIHHKKQSNKDNIKKRRGSRRLDDDIVDPAQPGPVAATLLAKQGHGHPGRRASGTTRSPPESLDVSKSPPRSGYRTMRTGTTPPRTTNDDTTIRRAKRRGAGGGSGGKTRCSAAGVGLTAPPPGKTAVPLTIEELVRGTLTEEEIRVAAGRSTTRELQDVAKLALVIDSSEVSVEGVWDSLPKLHTLNLTGSRLLSFRDLGVGLRHLNTLYLESSCVQDLDGIGALSGLRELHLADNRISDATPLACHGSLQILSLERNRVSDMNALEILSSIPLLYSLNLRNNPLMDSLGKLRDGRGRHVVHQLIPQIRVLDGTHLSSGEGGPIDAQTLDEAGDLICQGASRARAAWAEEEETTATAAATGTAGGNGWRHRGGGGGGGGGAVSAEVGGSSFSRRATRPNVRVAEAEAEANDVQPPPPSRPEHAETIHWDSDLTQGGRQALSGNPSSAIRRHKSGRGAGKGGNGHSPTRVLETLDLAKIMELGLKHRHNTQQSAERVSEWRRETCSDSVPEEDPCTARLGAAVPLSRLDAIPLSTSALEGCFDRRVGRGTCEGEGSPARTTATWASSSASAACGSAEVAAVDGDARQLLLVGAVGRRNSSGRPWTTGGFVGGGRATTTVAAAAISGSDRAGADHPRRQAPAQKNETAAEEQGHRGGQETRPHPRRRRPQTAKEPAGKRCGVPGFDDSNASWQPVWESLRTARLISSSSPRTTGKTTATAAVTERAEKGVVAGRASLLGGADGAVDKKPGSVDFGRQRRARTTARAARGGDYDYLNDSDCEAPEEDVGSSGSDDSEEAGDRALIKRRASELASKASGVVDGISCPAPAAVPPPPCSPLAPDGAPEGLTASTDNHKVAHHAAPHKLVASVESQRAHGRPKARQREKASLALRRSLAVMDDDTCSSSSSDDDEARRVLKRSEPPAPGGKLEERPGVGQSKIGNTGLGGAGGVAGGGGSPGGRGSTSSPRREPSAHASRLLGFDLKKSLAAIDEWTDKAGTTARNSGSNSGSKGGTPREGAAKALGVHQQAPFIIGHTATVGGMSPLSSSSSQTLSEVAGREVGDRGLRGGKAGGVPVAKRPTPSIQQNKHGSPARAGNHNTADTDDDEYDDGEAVLSVAAARAALGISKAATAVDTAGAAPCGRSARGAPSLAEIDAITAIEGNDLKGRAGAPPAAIEGRRKQRNTGCGGNSRSSSGKNSRGAEGGRSARTTSTGMAVSMSDEDLKNMLKQQPRMVPELRTKESFREFFRGMEAARMSRLLRGAYEGNLPADQVDKKVKKRLGLVGDRLAW